jgi:glycosidase
VLRLLRALTTCYKFWMAYADVDGFRIDTVKHVETGGGFQIFWACNGHEQP